MTTVNNLRCKIFAGENINISWLVNQEFEINRFLEGKEVVLVQQNFTPTAANVRNVFICTVFYKEL